MKTEEISTEQIPLIN